MNKKINDNVYVLTDRAGCCTNLIIGEEKALLFDTGSGVDNMYEKVREITNLPLLVICSHGHFDHIGGAQKFEEVYVHPNDFCILKNYGVNKLNELVSGLKEGLEFQKFQSGPMEWECIKPLDFQEFDLGKLICKIVPLPGHSAGSIGVLIPDLKLLLSGDALLPVMCLIFENHLSIDVQYQTLQNVLNMNFQYYLTSHSEEVYQRKMTENLKECIEKSKARKWRKYRYPYPPYTEGWISLLRTDEEPVAVIVDANCGYYYGIYGIDSGR